MTSLECRCRLLLRAYPAAYRQEHGEEILGTLLEATPAGRSWPLAREIRCLAVGSLRVRAALNRRLTTAANLRLAVFVGAAAYLAVIAVADFCLAVSALTSPARGPYPATWLLLTTSALLLLAVGLAWFARRRTVVLAGPIAAAFSAVATIWRHEWIVLAVPQLVCLAALALLADCKDRPGRQWLWPVALIASWPLAAYLLPGFSRLSLGSQVPVAAVGILCLLWVAVDARPAVATVVFALAFWLPWEIFNLVASPDIGTAIPLLIACVLAATAVWCLQRQSARPAGARR